MSDNLSLLNGRGVCCVLNVSYPRFRESLDPSLFDFRGEDTRTRLRAPTMALLADMLKPIEQAERQGRQAFAELTYQLGMGVGLRFCPLTTLEALVQRMDACRSDFDRTADELIASFDAGIAGLKQSWLEYFDGQDKVPEHIRSALKANLLAKFPSVAPSRKKFQMTTRWFELTAMDRPSLTDLDAIEAERVSELWNRIQRESAGTVQAASEALVDDCRRELLSRMHKFFTELNGVVQTGKPVNKRTMDRLHAFTETVGRLNFMKDGAVMSVLDDMKRMCRRHGGGGVKRDADVADIKNQINQAVARLELESQYVSQSDDTRIFDATVKVPVREAFDVEI